LAPFLGRLAPDPRARPWRGFGTDPNSGGAVWSGLPAPAALPPFLGTDPDPNYARHAGQPAEPNSTITSTSTQARFWGRPGFGDRPWDRPQSKPCKARWTARGTELDDDHKHKYAGQVWGQTPIRGERLGRVTAAGCFCPHFGDRPRFAGAAWSGYRRRPLLTPFLGTDPYPNQRAKIR